MGQQNSVESKTEFKTDVINEVAQSFVSEITNSADIGTYENATIMVELGDGASLSNCNISATNTVSSETKALINTMANKSASLSAAQTTKITNDVKKQIEQQNKALGLLPQNNTVEDSLNVSNDISNKINQAYQSTVANKIGTITVQGGVITFKVGKDFKCENSEVFLSNDLVSKTLNESILNSVDTFLSETNQTTDVLNKYDLKVKQSNVGVDPLGILGIIAFIILLVLLVPLFIGGPILSIVKTFIVPLLMVGGYIGTFYFGLNGTWIAAFICLALTWVMFFMKVFSPTPQPKPQQPQQPIDFQNLFKSYYPFPMNPM